MLWHVAAAPFSGGTVGAAPWYSALLLKPEKILTLKKLYTRNFPKILVVLFFWAFCYKLVAQNLMDSLTLPDVADAAKHLLLSHHE